MKKRSILGDLEFPKPKPYTHHPECQKVIDDTEKIRKAWEKKWPDHCKKCHGYGGFYDYYDPSPAGICLASGRMVDFEPCQECYEKGLCPRCGKDNNIGDAEEFGVCKFCGWDEKEPDGLMDQAECFCIHMEDWYGWDK